MTTLYCLSFFYTNDVKDQLHRGRKILNIGGGGGGGGGKVQNIGGGGGGKLFACCKLIGAPAPNQCQLITFFVI